MEKPIHSESKTVYNEGLRDALRGIYEVYGSNLDAFFRDASEGPRPHETRAVFQKLTKVREHGRRTSVRKVR